MTRVRPPSTLDLSLTKGDSVSATQAHQLETVARSPRSTPRRQALYVGLGAGLIFTLILFEPTGNLEFAIVLLGPLLTGIVMQLRGWPWKLGAAAWGLNGLTMLSYDWIINNEDRAFHGVLTVVMVALVALGAAMAQASRRLGKKRA
jgi:hypothetical protein